MGHYARRALTTEFSTTSEDANIPHEGLTCETTLIDLRSGSPPRKLHPPALMH